MRIGLIADIHGNADALRAVLDELRQAGLDRLVCLGDVAVLGPEPGAVIRLLDEADCAVVRGNTDAWLLDEPSDAIPPSPGPSQEILAWTRAVLTSEEIAQVSQYPMSLEVDLDGGRLQRCAHGSPRSFEDVIGPETPADQVLPLLGTPPAAVVAGGHTHVQMLRRFGETTFVNPGSTGLPGVGPGTEGLPINRDVAWAEFAIVDAGERGIGIELRRIPLDVAAMVRTAERCGMPHLNWWRSRWA
jgi:putative phosphoesterase